MQYIHDLMGNIWVWIAYIHRRVAYLLVFAIHGHVNIIKFIYNASPGSKFLLRSHHNLYRAQLLLVETDLALYKYRAKSIGWGGHIMLPYSCCLELCSLQCKLTGQRQYTGWAMHCLHVAATREGRVNLEVLTWALLLTSLWSSTTSSGVIDLLPLASCTQC